MKMKTTFPSANRMMSTYEARLIEERTIFENANQKLAYLYLVSYGETPRPFPSIEDISIAICSSTRTAMRVLQQLEEIGLIEVQKTPGKLNQYFIHDYFEVIQNDLDGGDE